MISGHCTIGERSFLGVNSTLRDFCSVGKDCFVSMGADVGRDILGDFNHSTSPSDVVNSRPPS